MQTCRTVPPRSRRLRRKIMLHTAAHSLISVTSPISRPPSRTSSHHSPLQSISRLFRLGRSEGARPRKFTVTSSRIISFHLTTTTTTTTPPISLLSLPILPIPEKKKKKKKTSDCTFSCHYYYRNKKIQQPPFVITISYHIIYHTIGYFYFSQCTPRGAAPLLYAGARRAVSLRRRGSVVIVQVCSRPLFPPGFSRRLD